MRMESESEFPSSSQDGKNGGDMAKYAGWIWDNWGSFPKGCYFKTSPSLGMNGGREA